MERSLLINNAIFFSALLTFVISYEMLSAGITAVFPHLFYIPILISAYYYPRQGVYISSAICLLYIIPVIFFFPHDLTVILSALIRVLMFIVIAGLVSYLVEKSLEEREEKDILLEFQNKIIENPQVMVVVSDMNGRVVIWNRGAENISGYSKSEVMGKKDVWCRILPDNETVENLKSVILKITSDTGSIEGIPFQLIKKNGDVRYLIVSLQVMKTKNGKTSGILGIAVDISEKRDLEAGNRTALAQIEKNVSKMYILNDQIRNPLAVILGQVELNHDSSRQIICEQVIQINDIISQLDRDSIESTKILDYLRKHYGFFNDDQKS